MFKTQKEIMDRINKSEFNAFTTYDFFDLANYKTISKSLELLEDEGFLRRVKRGIYYKPRFNEKLLIECKLDLNDVALAIARQYNWIIIPSGNYALNLIGLSTQVPNKIVFISNGPYREYEIGAKKIIFKHTTTREISSLRKNNLITIQAIKELGKNNINVDDIKILNRFLDYEDKEEILNGIRTTSRIYEILRSVACI